MFDPETAAFLSKFSQVVEKSKNAPLPEARKMRTALFAVPNNALEPVESVIDKEIEVVGGSIPMRIFIPKRDKEKLPLLLFFHGGGWVFGSIEEAEDLCRKLANRLQCIVTSVEYRLAPEHPFPTGLNDCYAALLWMIRNGPQFSIDPQDVYVGGESAGGNFAAAISLMARDLKECTIAAQLLLYPALDPKIDEEKYAQYPGSQFLPAERMKMFWKLYVQDEAQRNNPYASPLKASHFKDLPKAIIITAALDPLCPEAELYAQLLARDGTDVTVQRYPNALHGFLGLPMQSEQKEQALLFIAETLKKLKSREKK